MNVCITGGTGSLGTALIPTLLTRPDVERVVILSRDEVKQGDLAARFDHPKLRCFLGDIRDRERCTIAFYGCDTVIHAAALKRITQSVYSPLELIKTNVLGTINVIMAALKASVKKVLVISSDKAVEATNLYGKTKAVAEDFAVQSNSYTHPQGTCVSVVRYGNVMGSRGGVLEVWAEQCRNRLPLTLTDHEMTRFLISLSQAVDLIQTALTHMEGGEIFVSRLPAASVEMLGSVLYPEKAFVVTGKRPGGEKIHELLLSHEEVFRIQQIDVSPPWLFHPPLYRIIPSHHSWRADWGPAELVGWMTPWTSEAPVLSPRELRTWLEKAGLI